MSKKILVCCIITQLSIFSVCYGKDLSQAAIWYGVEWYYDNFIEPEQPPLITNLTYSAEDDTVINNIHYRKILLTHEYRSLTNAYRGAIRHSENQQKAYFVPYGSNTEYLLFDFEVKQGDVVYAYDGFNDTSCEYAAQQEPEDFSVTSAWEVLSIEIQNGRKHILVQNNKNTVEWIEGIGTCNILWSQGQGCAAAGPTMTHWTLCAADSEGNILYSFDTNHLGFANDCQDEIKASINNTPLPSPCATKFLQNGQLFILRDGKTYTLQGVEVK